MMGNALVVPLVQLVSEVLIGDVIHAMSRTGAFAEPVVEEVAAIA